MDCALWRDRSLTFVLPGSSPSGHAFLDSAQTKWFKGYLQYYQALHFLSLSRTRFFFLNSLPQSTNVSFLYYSRGQEHFSPQPPRMPLSPPALGSRGPAPGLPCESSGAKDEQTEEPNSEQTLHKYEPGVDVFASQSLAYVLLTCSIMCLTFLCWLFSMSSRWWIFSLRIATSLSNCSALKIHTDCYGTL